MTLKHDAFQPEQVDEQVDQFSLSLPGEHRTEQNQKRKLAQKHTERVNPGDYTPFQQEASARLVKELQAYYRTEFQQNQAFLVHAWQQIAAHELTKSAPTRAEDAAAPPLRLAFSQRMHIMQNQHTTGLSRGRRFARRMGVLAASLVALALVGTLVAALVFNHNSSGNTVVGSKTTPAASSEPTPTPPPAGTVLHTQPSPTGTNSYGLSWSPDGKRVASVSDDPNGDKSEVQIWDATTGGHLITIPVSAALGELDWSPNGKYLALSNLQKIFILDSQTGSTVKMFTYANNTANSQVGPIAGEQPLSSQFANGSGYGFYATAWTPDGSSLAVSLGYLTYGKVELMNPLTGAVKTTLQSPNGAPAELSFSSDGKYLVGANMSVTVWQVSTRAIVFQQDIYQQAESVAWQPGTHNLTEALTTPTMKDGKWQSGKIQNWDIDTQKLVKTYTGVSGFAWSPDGKMLATYTSPLLAHLPQHALAANKVVIIDAASGKTVATYQQSQQVSISYAAWSPDGHAIATVETRPSAKNVIRVWVA